MNMNRLNPITALNKVFNLPRELYKVVYGDMELGDVLILIGCVGMFTLIVDNGFLLIVIFGAGFWLGLKVSNDD